MSRAQNGETLVPLEDVQRLALTHVSPLPPTRVPLDDALGCVLAADVLAAEDIPPFANTAMDGFAVRAADTTEAPVELEVIGILGAGSAPTMPVGPGQAMQIMTGAPMPEGADAIAIVERTEPAGVASHRRVRILDQVAAGAHLRAAGSDLAAGQLAVPAGTLIAAAHVGVLASVGAGTVLVHPRPRVGVMTTGDELVEFAADGTAPPLAAGQIRDSNRHALLATVRRDGFEPVDLGIAVDTEAAVSAGLERALGTCDAVLTTGGVSKGEFDYVKVVLARLAAEAGPEGAVHELGVAIRPAKPIVISWLRGGPDRDRLLPVFGLPGNPVSSLVSYQAIALPALRVLAGHAAGPPPTVPAVAGTGLRRHPDGKTHLLRVEAHWRGDGRLVANSIGGQMSHQLASMAMANALALVPDGDGLAEGEDVELIMLAPLPIRRSVP